MQSKESADSKADIGKKRIVVLDFDGVIHNYKSWQGIDVVDGEPVDGAFEFICNLLVSGFQVHIFSARSVNEIGRRAMRDWFIENGFDDTRLGCSVNGLVFADAKPPAFLSIDDRAMCFDGVFPSVAEVSNFKPWWRKERK